MAREDNEQETHDMLQAFSQIADDFPFMFEMPPRTTVQSMASSNGIGSEMCISEGESDVMSSPKAANDRDDLEPNNSDVSDMESASDYSKTSQTSAPNSFPSSPSATTGSLPSPSLISPFRRHPEKAPKTPSPSPERQHGRIQIKSSVRKALDQTVGAAQRGILNFFKKASEKEKVSYQTRAAERQQEIAAEVEHDNRRMKERQKIHARDLNWLRQQRHREKIKVLEIQEGTRSPNGTKKRKVRWCDLLINSSYSPLLLARYKILSSKMSARRNCLGTQSQSLQDLPAQSSSITGKRRASHKVANA